MELSDAVIEKAIDDLPASNSQFASKLSYSWAVVFVLAFGHTTGNVIVGNQTMINKNFHITGDAIFIIFKNSPKFEYREFISAIYAKRKFDPSSSTSIWRKYLGTVSLRAVKKIDKDRFLSIRLILSIIDKNFNLSIVIDFLKIHHFLRKLKNCFGGTFDNFLGKGVILRQKSTATFFITNEVPNTLLFSSSFF